MKKLFHILFGGFLLLTVPYPCATAEEIPMSGKELVERLTRIEARLGEGQKNIQIQIEGLQRQIDGIHGQMAENQKNLQRQIDGLEGQIDDVRYFVMWGFGVLAAGMFALTGFVIWDRRTALAPTMREVDDLRRRERDMEDVLHKFARVEPKLADVMKELGMM